MWKPVFRLFLEILTGAVVGYIIYATTINLLTTENKQKSWKNIYSVTDDRILDILKKCGELCDWGRPVQPGSLMGLVRAKVNCDDLFSIDNVNTGAMDRSASWEEVPSELQDLFSQRGLIRVINFFTDGVRQNNLSQESQFSKKIFDLFTEAWHKGEPLEKKGIGIPGASASVNLAADKIGIEGKRVLVIGSRLPWLEAILFTKNPLEIVTLVFGKNLTTEHPKHKIIQHSDIQKKYHDKTLGRFDAVFSFSTLEHLGLGYGDNLNPWADIITIGRAWCLSTPDAKLAIGVPTSDVDQIEFNAHRIYGPRLYPTLVTNWKFWWSSTGDETPHFKKPIWTNQPFYIFEKIISD